MFLWVAKKVSGTISARGLDEDAKDFGAVSEEVWRRISEVDRKTTLALIAIQKLSLTPFHGAARRHGGGRRCRLARRTRDAPAWCPHSHDVGRGDPGKLVCRVASLRRGPGRISRHACANCSPHDQRNGATQRPLCITCTFRRDGTQELGGRMSLTLARKKKKGVRDNFFV